MVRLYLEDIQEIERALADLGPDAHKVEVSNGEWEAETVAELAEKGEGPFGEFSMSRYGPGLLSVDARSVGFRVYVSNTEDLKLRGAYEKICSVVAAAQAPRPLRWLCSWDAAGVALGVGIAAAMFALFGGLIGLSRGERVVPSWAAVSALVAIVAGVVWSTLGRILRRRANGLAYLVPKSARPSFARRNRDALGMLLIGTLLGSVVTFLFGRLAG